MLMTNQQIKMNIYNHREIAKTWKVVVLIHSNEELSCLIWIQELLHSFIQFEELFCFI